MGSYLEQEFLSTEVTEFAMQTGRAESETQLVEAFETTIGKMRVSHFVLTAGSSSVIAPLFMDESLPYGRAQHPLKGGFGPDDSAAQESQCSSKPFCWLAEERKGWVKRSARYVYDPGKDSYSNSEVSFPVNCADECIAVASFEDDHNALSSDRLAALELITAYFAARLTSTKAAEPTITY